MIHAALSREPGALTWRLLRVLVVMCRHIQGTNALKGVGLREGFEWLATANSTPATAAAPAK